MKRTVWLTMVSSVAALGLVAGCGSGGGTTNSGSGGSNNSGNASKSTAAPASQQAVSVDIMTEPPTLDPAKSVDTTSAWVLDNIMEGLVYQGKAGKIEPGVAKTWDLSTDGKVYTFHLRDNAKWTNGDPVTASDFVYSWLHTLDPNTGAQFASYMYFITGAQNYNTKKGPASAVAIKAVDDHTLQVTLNSPTPFFLSLISGRTFEPVDPKVAKANPKWAADASTFVGDGPFKLTEWKHQQDLVMEKNPDYWNASAIKLTKITADMVNDTSTQYQMYRSGQLSMDTSLPLDLVPKMLQAKTATAFPYLGTQFIEFNTKSAPFTNALIRQAFTVAIDHEQIVKDVLQGGEKAAYSFVAPGMPGAHGDFQQESGKLFSSDPSTAKALLQQGMKQLGITTLPAITFDYDSGTAQQKLAEAMQQMWQQNLGVHVNLRTEEWKVYLDKLGKGNYQFARLGWIDSYADPTNILQLETGGFGANFTGFKNAQYDKLVQDAESTTDVAKREQEMHQAEKLLMEQMPVGPINFYTNVFAFSNKLGNFYVLPSSSFPDMRMMYVK